MQEIKGLIIDTPHIDNILSGGKIWEMRSTPTKQRCKVALIRKGSGTVIGVAELIDSVGPFSRDEMFSHQSKHMISTDLLNDPKTAKWNNAWVMKDAKKLQQPVPYKHPSGAVIWVTLDPTVVSAIRAQL